MTVRHLLLDADGVLQELPGGWVTALEPWLGDGAADFLRCTVDDEMPALRGEEDFLEHLARRLAQHDVGVTVEELFAAVWTSIELAEQSVSLVRRLRAAGYAVHLATNQERHRAAYMRSTLGYDDLFDVSCYSYDLGAAKPDRAFFERALARTGATGGDALLIDDSAPNIVGARGVGLAAEQWHLDEGYDVLLARLARHGVVLD